MHSFFSGYNLKTPCFGEIDTFLLSCNAVITAATNEPQGNVVMLTIANATLPANAAHIANAANQWPIIPGYLVLLLMLIDKFLPAQRSRQCPGQFTLFFFSVPAKCTQWTQWCAYGSHSPDNAIDLFCV